jgi:hypothetical protein
MFALDGGAIGREELRQASLVVEILDDLETRAVP